MTSRLIVAAIVTAALLCFASCKAPAQTASTGVASLDGDFERSALIIESDDGLKHEFEIYLATTYERQRQGLMFVRKMPQNMGMLFVYEGSELRSMWMKNTYISLDLVFARSDGTISSIVHDATPLTLDSRSSVEPVTFVLELNAGTARRLNIGRKSRIIWEPE
jgi:uncharacterized membrane protein (UPF0127 family)